MEINYASLLDSQIEQAIRENQLIEEKQAKLNKPKPAIRELTLANGLTYPSDHELIQLILGAGTKNMPVERLSQKVLEAVDSVDREDLVDCLLHINGIGLNKALAIAAAVEFGRRRNSYLKCVIKKSSDLIPYVQHYSMHATERFICVTLNGAHEIINIHVVSVGTTNKTIIHPREVFCKAVEEHASAIICCHNHPTGPCIPSEADRKSTRILQEAAEILGITFLDHLIISKTGCFSFLDNNLLD